MLTATYSLVTISTEQSKTRRILHRLQQYIQGTWKNLQAIDLACVESAFNSLTQFDKYFRTRKVEVYLIPAVRRATNKADSLLAELEELSAIGMGILRSVREQLRQAYDGAAIPIIDVCRSMDLYCTKLLTRMAKEEDELFPLVRKLFSVDEWFALAEKFLAEEAATQGRKRHMRRPPAVPAANSASTMIAH